MEMYSRCFYLYNESIEYLGLPDGSPFLPHMEKIIMHSYIIFLKSHIIFFIKSIMT